MLNARIRKAWLRGASIGLVGEPVDLTYDYVHVGNDRKALESLSSRNQPETRDKPTLVIVGQSAIREADGEAVLATRCGWPRTPTRNC